MSRRKLQENSAEWDVLVAGSAVFTFSFDVEGEQIADGHFLAWETFDLTNELKLASTKLRLELRGAATMTFQVLGKEFLTLGPSMLEADVVQELAVLAQTVGDIVAIERLSGQSLDPCNGRFDDCDRVRLRRMRLMWEGHVVHGMRHEVTVTAPNGRPPQVIAIAEGVIGVGGSQVPTPRVFMRHPGMTAVENGFDPAAGPEAKKYTMKPPNGAQFIAWSPDSAQVLTDHDLVVTASWGLLGIDESSFAY